jgi:hypothetical protein
MPSTMTVGRRDAALDDAIDLIVEMKEMFSRG